MAFTKAQIRDRASEMLGFNPTRQTLESNISTRIEESYDEVYEMLKDDGLAIWASTGSVPTVLVPFVSALVAQGCISLGTSNERIQLVESKAATAKKMIMRYTTPHYQSQEDAKDY